MHRIDAEWITARKDWQEAKKRDKAYEKQRKATIDEFSRRGTFNQSEGTALSSSSDVYSEEMDAMRCMLYVHGGLCCILVTATCSYNLCQGVITSAVLIKKGEHNYSYEIFPLIFSNFNQSDIACNAMRERSMVVYSVGRFLKRQS